MQENPVEFQINDIKVIVYLVQGGMYIERSSPGHPGHEDFNLKFSELEEIYKKVKRFKALDELTAQAQELNMGY